MFGRIHQKVRSGQIRPFITQISLSSFFENFLKRASVFYFLNYLDKAVQSGMLWLIIWFVIIVIKRYISTINTVWRIFMLYNTTNKSLRFFLNFIGKSEVGNVIDFLGEDFNWHKTTFNCECNAINSQWCNIYQDKHEKKENLKNASTSWRGRKDDTPGNNKLMFVKGPKSNWIRNESHISTRKCWQKKVSSNFNHGHWKR